jgi:hypothetical protein
MAALPSETIPFSATFAETESPAEELSGVLLELAVALFESQPDTVATMMHAAIYFFILTLLPELSVNYLVNYTLRVAFCV